MTIALAGDARYRNAAAISSVVVRADPGVHEDVEPLERADHCCHSALDRREVREIQRERGRLAARLADAERESLRRRHLSTAHADLPPGPPERQRQVGPDFARRSCDRPDPQPVPTG